MNNPKILKKVLVVALALAMVVGAFAMLGIGASAAGVEYVGGGDPYKALPVYTLTNGGITFDDYAGQYSQDTGLAGPNQTEEYLRDYAGMFITSTSNNVHQNTRHAGAVIMREADGNFALRFAGGAFYINGNVEGVKDEGKFAKNSMLLDLFNNPNGPKKFSLSFDMKVYGDSGAVKGFAATSDSNGGSRLSSRYRGVSGVSLNGNWIFKITSANLPAIVEEIDTTVGTTAAKRVKLADSIPENMKDKGYIYHVTAATMSMAAVEGDDVVTKGLAALDTSKYSYATDGRTSSCLTQEMMDMDGVGDAVTYTLNEYFNVKFDVTRADDGKTISIDTYIGDELIGTSKHTVNAASGNSSDWAYGLRLFDQTSQVIMDNIKVTAPNNDFGDIHTGAWKRVKTELSLVGSDTSAGFAVVEKCAVCDAVFSKTYPNVAYRGVKSVGVDSSVSTSNDSIPATGTTPEVIDKTYHEDISGVWDTIKDAPYWINFDITDVTSVVGGEPIGAYGGGSSFLTWRNNGTGFTQLLRLFPGGELRTLNTRGSWTPNSSTFRLEGTAAEPGNYRFSIRMNHASSSYDVYIDDLNDAEPMFYFASGINSDNLSTAKAAAPKIRFNDNNVGIYRINNFTITQGVTAEEHIHTDEFSSADDKSVVVGYDTLSSASTCYCGAPASAGDNVIELVKECDSVYYGNAEISGLPTEGEFWFATDYNIRTAEALEAAAAAEYDVVFGDLSISVADKVAPATYQIALKVKYPEGSELANVEYYLDGKLIASYADVALSDTVKLGSLDTTDVRFNLTKVVKIGADGAKVAVTYIDSVDPDVVPCFHSKDSLTFILDATGQLRVSFECTKCGELVFDPSTRELHDEAASGVPFENGEFSFLGGTVHYYNVPAEVKGSDKDPYQISFKATLKEMTGTISNLYNTGSGRSFLSFDKNFNSILRTFPVDNGNGGYCADRIELKSRDGSNYPHLALIKEGETIDVSLLFVPKKAAVDIYINGVYMATNHTGLPSNPVQMRFSDSSNPTWVISDFSILVADSTHVHTDNWADDSTKTVFMTDKVLKYGYECYCGETVYKGDITAVHAETKNVYYGNATVENIPTTGNFWIVTDYNIRTEEAFATADNVIVLGNYARTIDAETVAKSTRQYAVNVVYTAEGVADISLYVDSVLTEVLKDVEMGDAATLTLGNDNADTTDIRFNNTRVISIGSTDAPADFTYVDGVDAAIRPCFHETVSKFVAVAGETYTGRVKAVNKLVKVSDCTKCGEKLYNEQGDVIGIYTTFDAGITLDETGSTPARLPSATALAVKREDVSIGADPYWMSFDISATFTEAQTTAVKNKGANGASILAFRVPYIEDESAGANKWDNSGDDYAYIHLMRAYSVDRTDAIGINFYQGGGSNPKFIMESGKSYHVELWIDPSEDGYHWKAYLDGVLVEERRDPVTSTFHSCIQYDRADADIIESKNAALQRMFQFRFTDGNYGDIFIKNFALVKEVSEGAHVHSGLWLNDEEKAASKFVVNNDNTISYSYQCYCGEIATEGVVEALADGIVPAYNTNIANTVVENGVLVLDSVFAGSAMAKTLPAEGVNALISIGAQAIVSVDNEGAVYLGENRTDMIISENEWCDFAVRNVYEGYMVYFGGEYLGIVAPADVESTEITVGSEAMGTFHFDKMAVVKLSIDGASSFEVGTDGHVHQLILEEAQLIFDETRSAITIEYVCTVCDRPAVDGLAKNLYDDETTDEIEAVYAVLGTPVGGATIIEAVEQYTEGVVPYWFSADFTVSSMSNKNRQNVIGIGGCKVVLIDADGTLRLNDTDVTVIGKVAKGDIFNVTYGVAIEDGVANIIVYLDGIYCGTIVTEISESYDIVAGDNSSLVMDVTNIKLAEMGNGGQLHIGAFTCVQHTYDYNNAVINYLDLETFAITSECLVCGHVVTEKPVYNYYADPIAPVFNYGGVDAEFNEKTDLEDIVGYWIVADVNKRADSLGAFSGYVNLIGDEGKSLVLINREGKIMLGNGKVVGEYFGLTDGATTHNIAIQGYFVSEESECYHVYIDGKYVGVVNVADIKYTYESDFESLEVFGDPALENVKFYNIRSFVASYEGTPVTFEYAEATGVIPCPHVYDPNTMTKTAVFGEKIQFVYICKDCGERVHLTYTENLYDESINTRVVFDENGVFTLRETSSLQSTVDVLGSKGAPFWLKFDLYVEEVNPELVGANNNNNNGGRNLLNFGANYSSPLRLYADMDYSTGNYYDNYLIVRANSRIGAAEVARLYEGESYEFALYVDPATRRSEIYVDGKYVANRTGTTDAAGKTVRFLDGNWGTFIMSDFEFVKGATFGHTHTAEFSTELGMVPTLEYADQKLKHTFVCICGETIVEGVDKAIADEIQDITGVTSATAIPEAANKTVNAPYWVSSKVYSDGSAATVYSYNGVEIVGISEGVYTVGGVATDVAVSGVATAGDYDVVSINVDPINDVTLVYVNGKQISAVYSVDYAADEAFGVLLGGGASLDFKFIKVVTLAAGADNKVNIYDCGDHAFGYRSGIVAEVTSTGVDYKCKFCGTKIRTVETGNAKVFDKITYTDKDKNVHTYTGSVDINSTANYIEGADIYDNVLAPADGGNFLITFDIKPTDLGGLGDGGKSLVCWVVGESGYRWFFRAFKINGTSAEMKLYNGTDYISATKPIIFVNNTNYKVIIEVNPTTGDYHVYVDGNYMGGSNMSVSSGASNKYRLRFGDANTGKWTVTNVKLYNPKTDKLEAVTSGNDNVVIAHSHYPDTSAAHSINVVNGVITQEFKCVCGQDVSLTVMTDLVEGVKTDYKNIATVTKIPVGDALNKEKGTYVLSFDFTVNAINVPKIISSSVSSGRSIVSVEAGGGQLRLLRVFGHPYVEGEGYADRNGDGYADDVVDFRTNNSKSHKIVKTMGVGDTVNITYVIDPYESRMVVYVDNQLLETRRNFGYRTGTNSYLRLLDNTYGSFDFTNFKLVKMSDECVHEAPACSEGVHSGACALCGMTVEVAHNYTATLDRTAKWTKYTCEDCGKYYIVFNDMSMVADLTFASKSELMKYLSETYCPVFR